MSKGRAMISLPMGGKSEQEIVDTMKRAMKELIRNGYEVADTLFSEEWAKNQESECPHSPLWFLAKSLEEMSRCNTVYFCDGWEKARGCKIEHEAAVEYGLHIMYEDKLGDGTMMENEQNEKAKSMKTRNKLMRLLRKVQDNGEIWYVESNGCNRVDIVRNATVVAFLMENGVGFATDNNDGNK